MLYSNCVFRIVAPVKGKSGMSHRRAGMLGIGRQLPEMKAYRDGFVPDKRDQLVIQRSPRTESDNVLLKHFADYHQVLCGIDRNALNGERNRVP
jgi:hypothetical protein